jgi:hypothetical protein
MYQDPGHMMEWLENELLDLERKGGKAILLSHVPNNRDCISSVGKRFHALVDRFQTTIRGVYFSHVHREQIQIFRDVI